MKKLLLVLVIIQIVNISCQKKYCWKCQTIYNANFQNAVNSVKCDMTKSEIEQYEKANTKTQTVNNGNNNQTNTVESTHCTQQ
jgi:hypothetical protein